MLTRIRHRASRPVASSSRLSARGWIAAQEEDGRGAPESNAGDDFHFWWAASRALMLIKPGTDLRLLTLEGLATVDDPDAWTSASTSAEMTWQPFVPSPCRS